jgi:hypothetical protein
MVLAAINATTGRMILLIVFLSTTAVSMITDYACCVRGPQMSGRAVVGQIAAYVPDPVVVSVDGVTASVLNSGPSGSSIAWFRIIGSTLVAAANCLAARAAS